MAEEVVLLKAHTLQVAASGETTQPQEDSWLRTPNDAIEPPVALEQLQELSRINDVRATCVEAIATNTVGLGYQLTVDQGHERDIQDATQDIEQATAMLEGFARRDLRLEKPSLTSLLAAVKHDEEEIGQGYMEVSRDRRTGQISGLFHLPGVRMRRLTKRDGFVLLSASGADDPTYFDNYGEKVVYDRQGRPTGALAQGKSWARNEVIRFKLYSSEDRDYGMPRDAAMALEYLGDKLAKEANVSFFDSSGTPPTVLFVQGQEGKDGQGRVTFTVPRETSDRIASTLKSDNGHRHRVAIIPVPPGTTTSAVKLGEFSDRDVGFTQFRQDLARRTVSSFRLQPVFVPAVQDAGRYTAEIQRAITLEQLFDPEQKRYEDRLDDALLRELGFGHLTFQFRRLAVEDNKTRRDSADKMAENEAITRREYRQAHGFGPLPEAADGEEPKPGQVPFGWNDELVTKPKPEGANNREPFDDTRGLRPGLAGREPDPRREQKDLTGQLAA